MTREEAAQYLAGGPRRSVEWSYRDATGNHYVTRVAWIDDDGEWVTAHPTDWRAQPIALPAEAVLRPAEDLPEGAW